MHQGIHTGEKPYSCLSTVWLSSFSHPNFSRTFWRVLSTFSFKWYSNRAESKSFSSSAASYFLLVQQSITNHVALSGGLYSWIYCHNESSWMIVHHDQLLHCGWGLYSRISCHNTSSLMVFRHDKDLHSSDYVALSGSPFINILSQWEQLYGCTSWQVASLF